MSQRTTSVLRQAEELLAVEGLPALSTAIQLLRLPTAEDGSLRRVLQTLVDVETFLRTEGPPNPDVGALIETGCE